jgi:DNA processing protein
MSTSLEFQIGLTLLHGIGPKKASLIVSKLGSPEAVFKETLRSIHQQTGINAKVLRQMNREKALEKAHEHAMYLDKHKINTHFYLESTFPRRLKQCEDAPLLLYSKGNIDPNPKKVIAIVGTRSATDYGRRICEELLHSFAGSNIQVISGMAYGIDICAHQLCVKKEIETIGILGHGLDRIYPRTHKNIADQMLQKGGLMTEYLPGTNPDRENFPMRNRIVAGMSDATIVIESKKKGGSLITANIANDYNRDVFAYPGNVGQEQSEGCNYLIQQQKAHLILSGNEFIKHMGWEEDTKNNRNGIQKSCFVELNEQEKTVFQLLEKTSTEHIDVLSLHSGIPISQMNVLLFHLEMKGLVKTLPGKKYGLI